MILFGKYELLERINVGGMAEIVLAKDTGASGHPLVAVKRILPHLVEDEQFVTMFLDESRVLESLDHQDIIGTREVGTIEGVPYIALEYVDGKDARMVFHECRRQRRRVPISLACYIMARTCDGLHAAHERLGDKGKSLGLVHRDVSLQNLLLSFGGDVKVTDFGIAMSASNRARTEVGVVKGKFGYMSPEQIKGSRMDRRSDVFAAGICLYELLTCERLFSGDSDYAAIERVRNVDIDRPSSLNGQIALELEGIVMKALARRPKHRYQTAGAFRDALLAFLQTNNTPVEAANLGAYLQDLFGVNTSAVSSGAAGFEAQADPFGDLPREPALDEGDDDDDDDDDDEDTSVHRSLPPRDATGPTDANGLEAFGDLEQVSVVTGLEQQAAAGPSAMAALSSDPGGPGGIPRVPPVVPHRASIPPQYSSGGALLGAAMVMPVDWGDDEVPTRGEGPQGVRPPAQVPEDPDLYSGEATGGPLLVEQTFSGAPVFSDGLRPSAAPPTGGPPLDPFTLDDDASMETRRSPIVPALLASAAIVVAVTLGLVVAKSVEPGRVLLAAEPPDAVVTLNGHRIADTDSPYEILDLDPEQEHEIAVARVGHKPWQTRVRVQPGQALALPVIVLEKLEPPGKPDVSGSDPGVQQGSGAPGSEAGKPLVAAALPVTRPKPAASPASVGRSPRPGGVSGKRVSRQPARPLKSSGATIAAPAGKEAAPPKGFGTLRINSRPWSQVFLDGRLVGNTPQMSLRVSPGTHKVELVNPQFQLRQRLSLKVARGQTVTKVVQLQ